MPCEHVEKLHEPPKFTVNWTFPVTVEPTWNPAMPETVTKASLSSPLTVSGRTEFAHGPICCCSSPVTVLYTGVREKHRVPRRTSLPSAVATVLCGPQPGVAIEPVASPVADEMIFHSPLDASSPKGM